MYFRIIVILTVYLVTVTEAQNTSKDAIGFPEVEENLTTVNKQNRTPVFIPSMCSENELFYPGDQKDDWICDCRPGHLYHPDSDKCWPAYRKGPCADDKYLILLPNTAIPICAENPCQIDSMVPWKGKCQKLGTFIPCGNNRFPAEALWVNATTLNIECIPVTTTFMLQLSGNCNPGCKRFIENKCTPA